MMAATEHESLLREFCSQWEIACGIAKTAERNRKSLRGHGFYADKFHDSLITLAKLESEVRSLLQAANADDVTLACIERCISTLKQSEAKARARTDALRQLRLTFNSVVIPHIHSVAANPTPRTEQVLPMSVVAGTRGYLEKIVQQANGCYEHQWFDACAVMVRKFVEILIIEVFEAHGKAADIQDKDNNFFMLRDLVDRMLSGTTWNLGRETKKRLPEIRDLGNRAAHNRRFVAQRQDVDRVLPGLRVIADELLHLAKLK